MYQKRNLLKNIFLMQKLFEAYFRRIFLSLIKWYFQISIMRANTDQVNKLDIFYNTIVGLLAIDMTQM